MVQGPGGAAMPGPGSAYTCNGAMPNTNGGMVQGPGGVMYPSGVMQGGGYAGYANGAPNGQQMAGGGGGGNPYASAPQFNSQGGGGGQYGGGGYGGGYRGQQG